MKKLTITIIAIVILAIIAAIIKFSAVATPGKSVIKKYSYSGNIRDFISHIQAFCVKDRTTVFKITDTTGTTETGYRFYMDIELKIDGHDVLYSVACENGKGTTPETEVELIMAYDKTARVGGYNKNVKGIKSLMNNFDIKFIVPFENSENITLTTLE